MTIGRGIEQRGDLRRQRAEPRPDPWITTRALTNVLVLSAVFTAILLAVSCYMASVAGSTTARRWPRGVTCPRIASCGLRTIGLALGIAAR